MTGSNRLYRILFHQNDKVYEIYTRYLSDESLMGFVEAESLIFSETEGADVSPELEALKAEFLGVNRVHIPVHLIIRIDEVDQGGLAKVTSAVKQTNVKIFPTSHLSLTRTDND